MPTKKPEPEATAAPVVLFIYNRPQLARLAMESIRLGRPERLYIIGDAPKDASEAKNCALSRRLVGEVDWPCEVASDFSSEHLGCAKRIASGVDWVFEQEDRAIFLEEDCIAKTTFFPFCEALLDFYASCERVMMITGFNLLARWRSNESSYTFSRLGSSWGWATWKRAWNHFDPCMRTWADPATRELVRSTLRDDEVFLERARLFDAVAESRLDSWAVPWNLACILRNACCAVPSVNVITNLGFGRGATHHQSEEDPNANVPTHEIAFPLTHPKEVIEDADFDARWNRKATGRSVRAQ